MPPAPPAAKPSGHALSIGSTDPIKPVPVKTLVVKLAPPKHAPATKPAAAPVQAEPVAGKPAPVQTASLAPVAVQELAAPQPAPARIHAVGCSSSCPTARSAPRHPRRAARSGRRRRQGNRPDRFSAETKPAIARSGWAIQIGAFEAEAEAKERLSAAQTKAGGVLKKAAPYTERTTKGEKTYYRARFAGFDRDQAEAACKQLKRSDIVCISMKI